MIDEAKQQQQQQQRQRQQLEAGCCCCRALFLAAPGSGQGKTTVTASLARLLLRNGKRVRVFKFGPDYLDPQILERASRSPVVQLDLWMAGEEWCRQELYRAAAAFEHEGEHKEDDLSNDNDNNNDNNNNNDHYNDNDNDNDNANTILLVEGAMGLYDGTPSSADLAATFGIPVALVMDVRAMAQTASAIAVGLRNYRDDFDMVGVIANKCGSNYHAKLVKDALPEDLPLFAALKRTETIELPERHLGLVQPSDQGEEFLEGRIEAGADLLEEAGILQHIENLDTVCFRPQSLEPPPSDALAGVIIAIAHDEAFSFAYASNSSLLKAMGATLCRFSPLHDDAIPEQANALWLPGGYPELHAQRLAENASMLASLRRFHTELGHPILAECGGFLYCMEDLIDLEEHSWPMAGLMQGVGSMKNKAG